MMYTAEARPIRKFCGVYRIRSQILALSYSLNSTTPPMVRAKKTTLNGSSPQLDPRPTPPRWHYAVAAVVAVGTLVWTMLSFFLKKEVAPPTAAPPTVQQKVEATNGPAVAAAEGAVVVIASAPASVPLPIQRKSSSPMISASQAASSASGAAVASTGRARVEVRP